MNLELRTGEEAGTAWLNFWDHAGGNDRVFLLKPDGTAQELLFEVDEEETYTPVNLIAELLKMCEA